MKLLSIFIGLFFGFPALAATPSFNAYFRASSGSNLKGGAQECYNNAGTSGNEFRLGNECGIYGEFQFGADVLKPANDGGPFWKMGSNFAFVYKNSTGEETNNGSNTAGSTNPYTWIVRELYTEGGNFDGLQYSVWAGKRYYRWGSSHMDDFYSIDMSGPGAGIANWKTKSGVVSMAVIQNSESNEFAGTLNVAVKNGRGAKTSVHVRLEEMDSSLGQWSFWLAGGTTPATTDVAGTNNYKSASGAMLAIRNMYKTAKVTNELGLAYGQSVMSSLTARGDLVRDCAIATDPACNVSSSSRVRAWESYTFDGDHWSGELALIYDDYNMATSGGSNQRWLSVGARPIYWFTDHLSLAFEAGVSNVADPGGLTRNLMRATIAPQMSLGKGYASRPVIRAYYTYNTWNDANRANFASTTSASLKDTSAQSLGVQTEIWF